MPNSSLCKTDTALSSRLVVMTFRRNVLYRLWWDLHYWLCGKKLVTYMKCVSFLNVDMQSAWYGELHSLSTLTEPVKPSWVMS